MGNEKGREQEKEQRQQGEQGEQEEQEEGTAEQEAVGSDTNVLRCNIQTSRWKPHLDLE